MRVKRIILMICILMLSFTITSCFLDNKEPVGIANIEKTSSEGLVDTYTIYYTDGSTSTFTITNGADGVNGKDGADGKDGEDGKNGIDSPKSITSIEKTGTNGLVDTYTIYFTDGTSTTFEITNGKNGEDGIDGEDGKDSEKSIRNIEKTGTNGLIDTYTIYYTDGTSTTFEITNGSNGINGEDGNDVTPLDLYEAYKDIYGDDITYAEFLESYLSFDTSLDESQVINNCLQSTAKVYCEFVEDNSPAIYTGSSVIYKIDTDYTYFITNYHVVYDDDADDKISNKIHCYLYGSESTPFVSNSVTGYVYDGYAIECEYIGGAIQYDIAIIKAKTEDVMAINENVKEVTFADDYYVGQTAIAIGNPNGEGISVTQGIVSVDSENISLEIDGTARTYRSLRIDTALYGGNSGGGLFNCYGELIGINNAGDTENQNINYAIPVQIVKSVANNIMLHHNDGDSSTNGVYKLTIGIKVLDQNSKYVYDSESGYGSIKSEILIDEVVSGSIAENIGLDADDIITSITINNVRYELDRNFNISDHILYLTNGVTFSFEYIRDNTVYNTTEYTVSLTDLSLVE